MAPTPRTTIFDLEWGVLTPGLRAEYAFDLKDATDTALGYVDLGTLPYALDGGAVGNDRFSLGLLLDWKTDRGLNLGLDYRTGLGGSDSRSQTIGARLGIGF